MSLEDNAGHFQRRDLLLLAPVCFSSRLSKSWGGGIQGTLLARTWRGQGFDPEIRRVLISRSWKGI